MNENEKINFDIDYSKVDPKKLNGNANIVKSYLIYSTLAVLLTIIVYLLNAFNIIDYNNVVCNAIILIIATIICVFVYGDYYYKFNDWRFYESIELSTCIKLIAIYVIVFGILVILSLHLPGVHISIIAIWGGGALSLLVYNIIAYLRDLNKMNMVSTYDNAIFVLKVWVNVVFISMFVFAYVLALTNSYQFIAVFK